jgi:Ca2+-transporting ATPase
MPILGTLTAPATAPAARPRSPEHAWHAATVEDVLRSLETGPDGLSARETEVRLSRVGPNRLKAAPGVPAWKILVDQLRSIVVLLLVAAALISLAIGEVIDAVAIGTVLVINAALGFVTEWRARRAMEALLRLEAPRALVIRGGRAQTIDAGGLVPGDIVQLEAGSQVPADVRLIRGADVAANEAALTGESLPVEKLADVVLPVNTPLADRSNMLHMGTTIATGSGFGVVIATGQATELGRIGTLVGSIKEEQTPLERRLDALGGRLAWLTLAVAGAVSALSLLHGMPLGVVLEAGIALAVAAMPEALPAVATIALAVGMRRMAHRHALVRRLPAVETLGATTVVCTDKTRTLTTGDMTVMSVWTDGRHRQLAGDGLPAEERAEVAELLGVAALATRPQDGRTRADGTPAGDPIDAAVLAALERVRGAGAPLPIPRALLPFSSSRKLMATFFDQDGGLRAVVKGAPERVLRLADRVRTKHGPRHLDDARRAELQRANDSLARDGLRVLGLASGWVVDGSEAALGGLTFEGFIALADPPADGVKDTIAKLRQAGLRTVMITGDQRGTAEAVGRELGVFETASQTVDGAEMDSLPPDRLADRIMKTAVFSRVSPEHKLDIVSALQARGEIVAMLGDGVNDAAALKKADVGVAMGIRGMDAAKEAAAIVLQDDRFETIAAAVEEGRVIFDNIRKFVFYLFSCNVAEILVLLVTSLAALPLPLLPLQLLWLNMVTDTFPALALAMEPGDPEVMHRPPRRPDEAILSRPFLLSILGYGTVITGATLAAFLWTLNRDPAHAPTMAFMTLAFAQIGHLGNARSSEAVLSPVRALANPSALVAVGLAVTLQLLTMAGPLAQLLDVTPLTGVEWLVAIGCASLPALVGQTIKSLRPGRQPAPSRD